jgi:tetratricopeptide (TPR) repeat protein
LAISERLAASDPGSVRRQMDLWGILSKLGDALTREGQHGQALAWYQRGLNIAETLNASDPRNTELRRNLATSLERMFRALHSDGKREQALSHYMRCLAMREQLVVSDTHNAVWRGELMAVLWNLGSIKGLVEKPMQREYLDRSFAIWLDLKSKNALDARHAMLGQWYEEEVAKTTP